MYYIYGTSRQSLLIESTDSILLIGSDYNIKNIVSSRISHLRGLVNFSPIFSFRSMVHHKTMKSLDLIDLQRMVDNQGTSFVV